MSTLPWDELQPDPVTPAVPDPAPPHGPIDWGEPPDRPFPEADVDIKALAKDLANEALSYARASLGEIRKGHTVDILNPTITAETVSGRELVVADAKSRSWRTLVQGLIFDVLFAIVASVAVLSGSDPFVKETWVGFGVLLLKSVVSAIISYFMRLRVTPTIKVPGQEMAVMPIPRQLKEEDK